MRNFQSSNYTPPPDEHLKRKFRGFGLEKFEGYDSLASLRQYAQVIETLPEWLDETDVGRLVYTEDTQTLYIGSSSGTWQTFQALTGGGAYVETKTLVAADITNKYITLSIAEPGSPSKTVLSIAGAPGLQYGVHFTIIGNQLSWNGLALDGVVIAGDKLTITYY